jgi:hypothetical protein
VESGQFHDTSLSVMISQGLVSALSIGAAMFVGGLLRTWARSRSSASRIDAHGWHVLTPVAFVYPLSFVFPAAFLTLVAVSITDKEPLDGAQMAIGVILLVVLGAGGAYSLWSTFGRRVRWKEDSVRLTRWFLPERTWRTTDAREVTYSDNLGFRVTFADGSRLRFSSYENGASQLARLLQNEALEASNRLE